MLLFFCVLAFLAIANGHPQYCPSANDLTVGYGGSSVTLTNRGWTIAGGGAASTKAAFNIIGGEVEYDINFANSKMGVNANIYTISPNFGSRAFNKDSDYCDGQGGAGSPQYCIEIDWIESNGACGGATAIHTRAGGGNDGCTAWGCSTKYNYNGQSSFHMKIVHAADGTMTIIRDGVTITQAAFSPAIQAYDLQQLKSVFETKGALIYSSIWTGWVPDVSGCSSGSGDLGSSSFTVSNLKITGTVVQGPTPTLCSTGPVAPSPPVAPVPVTPPPVALAAPVINSITRQNNQIPTSGSFPVTVSYRASQNSRITVDIHDTASGWAHLGGGYVDVSAGTGSVTVNPVFTRSIAAGASGIALKAWVVPASQIGNWEAATGDAVRILYVSVGGTTPAPVAPVAQPVAQPTAAPTNAPVAQPTAAPTNAPVAQPVAAPTPAPVAPQPVGSSGCVATINQNSNGYWFALLVSPGATSATITCAGGAKVPCVSGGYPIDSKPVWHCQVTGGQCVPTELACAGGSGSRLSEDADSSAGLAGWAIGLIVLAVVLTVLLVVAAAVYITRSSSTERV